LRRALSIAQGVTAAQFAGDGLAGKAIGEAINTERVRLLEDLRTNVR
jgi:hypothetical protein